VSPAATVPVASRATKPVQGDISALEENVARNPSDESYRKLLAVALHDDAMKDWWRDSDPKDKKEWL
jgi:hypothetical protein